MEYGRAREFIDEGYRAAKAAVPRIKALLLEKDPSMAFTPRGRSGAPDEGFRRRLEGALQAARAAPGRPGASPST